MLAFVRGEQASVRAAEARMFAAAVVWAHQHPADSIEAAASWHPGCADRICTCRLSIEDGREQELQIAGPGSPTVAEFAVAEFAAALGLSTTAGKSYLGHALEVYHRLPRTRALVESGQLPVWRARRIAEHTTGLCEDGAAYLDAQVAPLAAKVGPMTLARLVTEALTRYEPDRAEAEAAAAAEERHVRINALGQPGTTSPGIAFSGLSILQAVLDGDDAADLETAIALTASHLADDQRAADTESESLEVRRSKALGIIARDHLTHTEPTRTPSKKTVLHVHLAGATLHGCRCAGTTLARIEEGDHKVVLTDVLRRWLGATLERGEQIVVKPVIDLAEHHHVGAYEIPERLHEQTALRDHHCVFPHCTRPARRCDTDHTVPHDRGAQPGGPTCSCNLAPLCRRHHRLKTTGGWTYTSLDPGTYLWRSPHSYHYLVDPTGTRDVTPTERQGRPTPPHPQAPA